MIGERDRPGRRLQRPVAKRLCLPLFAKNPPIGYPFAMRTKLLFVSSGFFFIFVAAPLLHADQVEMQNGDRYFGKVLSVSADTVVLESEVLGKINVPRKKIASLAIGTNAAAPKAATNVMRVFAPTNLATAAPLAAFDLPRALRRCRDRVALEAHRFRASSGLLDCPNA